jgi:hypothetical protein
VTIAHDGYATEERRFVITTSRLSLSMMVALARSSRRRVARRAVAGCPRAG